MRVYENDRAFYGLFLAAPGKGIRMNIGDSYEVTRTVTPELTAEAAGSGGLTVFGTPFMAAMMENAAFTYLQQQLRAGKSSVGVTLNISHNAPTPLGMSVTARAEVVAISANGKMVDFRVSAWDEAGLIGDGTHRRAVVDLERFLAKCERRKEVRPE